MAQKRKNFRRNLDQNGGGSPLEAVLNDDKEQAAESSKKTTSKVENQEQPKPEAKEQPKEEPEEQPKPEAKEQPKEEPEEQPKPEAKEEPKEEPPVREVTTTKVDRRVVNDKKVPFSSSMRGSIKEEAEKTLKEYRQGINFEYNMSQLLEDGFKKQIAALKRELLKKNSQ